MPFGGLVRLRVPEPPLHEGWGAGPQRPTRRCSMLKAWVAEPGRTNTAELIGDGLVCAQPFGVVVTGESHTCAIQVDGTMWCWGDKLHTLPL